MKINTNPVRGMKDFLPDEAELREKVRRTIIDTYASFGYRKIETPVLEHLELLSGGDGGDNEKLTFKVLKRGNKLSKELQKEQIDENCLADSGIRYDLTVPLSRIYANNRGNIPLPFKVIQADWVFRAERPQKGRYRQFMQCDIDIIGEKDVTAEIDLLAASSKALLNLGFKDFTIKINDRRILHDLAGKWGFLKEDYDSVFITLDKLDKIGVEGVKKELKSKNLSQDAIIAMIRDIYRFEAGEFNHLYLNDHVKEVIEGLDHISNGKFKIEFDPTLVRGMGYYTGMIYEIKYKDYPGSVGGGGRYDKMIGKRLGQDVPACGFSIGFERIVDILLEKGGENERDKKIALIYDPEITDIKVVYDYAESFRKGSFPLDNEPPINTIDGKPKYRKKTVSVVKIEKKFGKQLKKLSEKGFTHYCQVSNDQSGSIIELKD